MFDNQPIPINRVRCQCLFCGVHFWSERSTATYCTASHKQKMYRWRTKLHSQKDKCTKIIKEIASYLTYEKSTPTAVAALHEVKHAINEALLQGRIVTVK